MAKKRSRKSPLEQQFDDAQAPIYLIDASRTIVYANAALADWVGLEIEDVLGRRVEYHSAPGGSSEGGLLTGLCPSPVALRGERTSGAISCVDRSGRLRRRGAEFLPMPAVSEESSDTGTSDAAVLVYAELTDLGPTELLPAQSEVDSIERLRAQLQQFRWDQGQSLPVECLLGESNATAKLRRQAAALAASGANALLIGPRGSGVEELARSIFQRSQPDATAKLLPLDAALLDAEQLSDAVRDATAADPSRSVTILLQNVDALTAEGQTTLARLLGSLRDVRVLATASSEDPPLVNALHTVVATLTLHAVPLADRKSDLPLLAQSCVEQANIGAERQIAGVSAAALDQLALYSWPGGFAELRSVIAAAHLQATSAMIEPSDLPMLVQQATLAAELAPRDRTPIVLDNYLATIERELVERALEQSGGNKAETARLLGMTRPRLYRRLARLGMLDAEAEPTDE